MSTPIRTRAMSVSFGFLAFGLNRSLGEVASHVRLSNPVVLSHPDGSELPGVDQAIDGHVGNPHRCGDLTNREHGVPDERTPLSHERFPFTLETHLHQPSAVHPRPR